MKKVFALIMSLTIGSISLFPFVKTNVIAAEDTATKGIISVTESKVSVDDAKFSEERFFVVVGIYNEQYTQLKYMYSDSNGGYTAEKIVWEEAPADLAYGDVLTADEDIKMTRVYAAPDIPVYAMAYYYTLDEGTELNKVGNCADIMEQKKLTVISQDYDGSGHWSIRYTDEKGSEEYYYGLNVFRSSLGVNPIDGKIGDVYTFAMYNGNTVIPLEKNNVTSNISFAGKYNELIQMTDAELSEKYSLSEFSFGDESIPDETKFAAYLNKVPDWYIGDNYESESYSAYKKFIKGENVPYIVFTVDRYTALNDTLTAENFGYPKEWNFVVYDEVNNIEMGVPHQFHEYRIEIPLDIISDFEQYVRLKLSYDYFKNGTFYDENPYGITAFNGIEQQFVSYGETVSNIYGDSNCDFNTDLADAILIMQALANPNKYGENGTAENHLTKQGKTNGDMDGDGLTVGDAQIIQDILLGL